MLFWPTMLSGVSNDDIDKKDIDRYRCSPINIIAMKFDWMLETISKDDQQTYVYRLLSEIMKKDMAEQDNKSDSQSFYDIPAVQAMIRFHHGKLQDYIKMPAISGLTILDLVQIIVQMMLINNVIDISFHGMVND